MSVFIKPEIIIGNAIVQSDKNDLNILDLTVYNDKVSKQLNNTDYYTNDILYTDMMEFCNKNLSNVGFEDNKIIINNPDKTLFNKKYRNNLPEDLIDCMSEINISKNSQIYILLSMGSKFNNREKVKDELNKIRTDIIKFRKNPDKVFSFLQNSCEKNGHVFGKWQECEDPFMDREWYYSRTCLICGKVEKQLEIPACYKRRDKRTNKVITYTLLNGEWKR